MCLGNEKMKPNADMTWKLKYSFVCISPLGDILRLKIFQGLNAGTYKGRGRLARALDSVRTSPESSETQWSHALF